MPGVFIEAADGHQCQCNACSPNFSSDLSSKLRRNIHREKQGELTEATKQRLVADAEKNFPTVEAEDILYTYDCPLTESYKAGDSLALPLISYLTDWPYRTNADEYFMTPKRHLTSATKDTTAEDANALRSLYKHGFTAKVKKPRELTIMLRETVFHKYDGSLPEARTTWICPTREKKTDHGLTNSLKYRYENMLYTKQQVLLLNTTKCLR